MKTMIKLMITLAVFMLILLVTTLRLTDDQAALGRLLAIFLYNIALVLITGLFYILPLLAEMVAVQKQEAAEAKAFRQATLQMLNSWNRQSSGFSLVESL